MKRKSRSSSRRLSCAVESMESRLLFSVFFVDAGAAAGGNGSDLSHAFNTIAQASAVAQAGDTVEVAGGIYHETIDPVNDGTSTNPITYQAMSGQTVTIDAADAIDSTATWTLDSPHVYKTTVAMNLGDQNSVFVDGKQMVEARWPNTPIGPGQDPNLLDLTKYASVGSISRRGTSGTIKSSTAGLPMGNLNGATLSILGGSKYAIQSATISGNSSGGSFKYTGLNNYQYLIPQSGSKFYVSGARVLLDAPGEWFYDNNSGQLYIYMPNGLAPAGHDVEVKARLNAVDLSGHTGIHVVGFNILGGSILTDEDSHSNLIDSITSTYGGRDATVAFGQFGNCFAAPQAVFLNGSDNTIENSTISFVYGNGIGIQGSDNRAINNTIHDVDLGGTYASGISIAGNRYYVVGNTIYNTARDGMHVLGFPQVVATNSGEMPQPSEDGRIAYNNVYNYGFICHDLGAIALNSDLNGSGTSIDHNWLHDNKTDNSIGFRGAGVYLDNGSSFFIVSHNVMWNNGDAGVWINVSSGDVKNFRANTYGNIVTNNTIPLMGQRRGIVINGAREPGHSNDAFGTRIANNLSAYFESSDNFLPGHAPRVDHNLSSFSFPKNYRSPSGLGRGVNIPGFMDNPNGHDAGAYEAGQTWFPGALTGKLQPNYVAPGATGDSTVLVVDNLDDLAKTFSSQGIALDNSKTIEGSDTGAAKPTGAGKTIIYRYNGITDFGLKFFGAPGTFQVFGSSDNATYKPILLTMSAPKSAGGSTYRTATPKSAIPANTNFLKIVLGSPSTELATAEIRYHDTDLAENHDGEASTFVFQRPGLRAQSAVDANPSTRWESQGAGPDPSPFFAVDLAGTHVINQIRESFFPENGQIPQDYTIQTSIDGVNYTNALVVANGSGETVMSNNGDHVFVDLTIPSTTARFVRFVPAAAGSVSLWSFEVYGT